ncbi:MAG: four helix bundle protein [Planctomycetota bacterium]|nr:four helix bundle protein [Planctomycetota bacterium]MDA1249076.1 four helix bundle protein [Planctomycetota bacterium]
MAAFGFEQLSVWQKAIEFADLVYDVSETFPRVETFGLTSQLRRAAVSVSSNLAEGSGRGSKQGFSRFVEIAFGSVCEVVSQTHLAKRRGFVTEEQLSTVRAKGEELGKMMSGLRSSLTRN